MARRFPIYIFLTRPIRLPAGSLNIAIFGPLGMSVGGMRGLWGIWLGPKPADEALKQGMLGNG